MPGNLNGTCSTMGTKRGSGVSTNMNALKAAIQAAGGPAYNDLLSMTAWVIAWPGPLNNQGGSDPGGGSQGGDSGGGGP